MVLREGQVLGPYRVVALAGSGGMGEVWRARDERLHRDVALKVLHPSADSPNARRRVLAEARSVSALNHPHIVVVHDVLSFEDLDVLVMEFVAGDVLSQRIPSGGLNLRDALKIAIPVADALATAHSAGVVHRDLKPANVLVSASGAVKVVDFGLARRRAAAGPTDVTVAGEPQSLDGLFSGTPAYMSPEQAEGRAVDHRSDVFSFGTLLYELLTGCRLFERGSLPETLTAVLKDEPTVPGDWPLLLVRIVRRCLTKDPDQRYQSTADLKLDLQELLEYREHARVSAFVPLPARSSRWASLAAAIAVALAAVMFTGGWWFGRARESDATWRGRPLTTLPGLEQQPVLSPDGEQVAFMWDGGSLGNHDIYVQPVNGVAPPLRLTSDVAPDTSPCWSPDGQQVAFLRIKDSAVQVMIVPRLGGAERRAAQLPRESFGGTLLGLSLPPTKIDWSPNPRWIAVGTRTISLLDLDTGEVISINPAPAAQGYNRDPAFSPDGRTLAFSHGAAAVYRQLWTQALDATGRPSGAPELLSRDFRVYMGMAWLDRTSLLTAAGWTGSSVGLFRVHIGGTLTPVPVESVAAWYPNYLAGRTRLAYQRRTIDTDIVRVTLPGAATMEQTPLIASTYQDREAKYSPDGTKIVFISTRSGQPAVWRSNSDGTNQVLIGSVEQGVPGSPRWTPDGQAVVFDASSPETGADIFIVSSEGGVPRPVTAEKSHELNPAVSGDGQWVYFGSEDDIWKVPIRGGAPTLAISKAARPQLSHDGATLYFNREGAVWRVPTGGGSEELFKANIDSWSIGVGYLYELKRRPGLPTQIIAHDLQTRAERVLSELPAQMRFFASHPIDVAPDGRSALISPVSRDESDLVVVDGFR